MLRTNATGVGDRKGTWQNLGKSMQACMASLKLSQSGYELEYMLNFSQCMNQDVNHSSHWQCCILDCSLI